MESQKPDVPRDEKPEDENDGIDLFGAILTLMVLGATAYFIFMQVIAGSGR